MHNKIKNWIINLLLLCGSTTLIFVIFEFASRRLEPYPQQRYRYSPTIYFEPIPNSRHCYQRDEFKVLITYNSQGLREDKEYPFIKPEDVFRIIMIGDSFTEAKQVKSNYTYPKVLERLFNNKKRAKRIEVLNLGLSGSSTVQQFIRLKELGVKFHPDLVIQMICANDLNDNLTTRVLPLYSIAEGQLFIHPLPSDGLYVWSSLLKHTLYNHSNLYWIIRMRLNKMKNIDLNKDEKTEEVLEKTSDDRKWNIMKTIIKETDGLLKKHNAAFCLSFVPFKYPSSEESYYVRKIGEISKKFNIPFLKLNEDVKGEQYFYEIDGHWNRAGHQKTAQVLYSRLESLGLIPH